MKLDFMKTHIGSHATFHEFLIERFSILTSLEKVGHCKIFSINGKYDHIIVTSRLYVAYR